jgi:hypothetical protein
MRTDAQRQAKYLAKTTPSTVGLKIAARLPGMKPSFAAFCNSFVPMQVSVAGQLDIEGVPRLFRGRYQAFAAELWRAKRDLGDPVLTDEAQIIHDKWEARGNTSSVMVAIALNVFNLIVV